ncbi:hypothetical protein JCM10450v2_000449 [Rhodotorula kratochvilovae]
MSTPGQSTRSPAAPLLHAALAPTLHCFHTDELGQALARNHLGSFADLVHPFLARPGQDRIQLRLPSTYDQHAVDRFPLHLVHRPLPPAFPATPAHQAPPTPATPFLPQSQAERDDLFLDALGAQVTARVDSWLAQPGSDELHVRLPSPRPRPGDGDEATSAPVADEDEGWRGRRVDALAPWYALVRDSVLARRDLVPHESFAHPVGVLVALSTSHPDPLNALAALWDLTSPAALFAPASYPPRSGAEDDARQEWATPDALRFIVLVHDFGAGGGRPAWEDAQRLHETVRKTYGVHTALLPLFSAAQSAADPLPPAEGAAALWASLPAPPAAPPPVEAVIGLGVDEPEPAAIRAPAVDPSAVAAPQRGHELSSSDILALRTFVRELVVQSLVPHLERQGVVLHEQWQAGRRSIGGRLFSVGRKYFGGGGGGGGSAGTSREGSPAPGGAGGREGYNAQKGYHHSSPLSLARRLADTAFFLGDYKLASSAYDTVAKDARTDKAWRHHAAALRMQALCALLLPLPSSSGAAGAPEALLAQAAAASPAGGAVSDFDALRATLLAYESYLALSLPSLAPVALVRAAADTEEIVAAVLLEQAALAELVLVRPGATPRRRKYAFWMAMAAARYEKCGVKALSIRCLSQSSTLFLPAPPSPSASPPPLASLLLPPSLPPARTAAQWSAIRTHLHHALARQSYTVGRAGDACRHFVALLGTGAPAAPAEEGDDAPEWLDDFALAWDLLLASDPQAVEAEGEGAALELPVRLFDAQRAKVRVGSATAAGASAAAAGEDAGGAWGALESALLGGANFAGASARPKALSYRGPGGGSSQEVETVVEAVLGETVSLEVPVRNPLQAFLALGGLAVDVEGEEGGLAVQPPQEVELAPGEQSKILIPVRAAALGTYTFRSLSYRFSNLLPVVEPLSSARWSKPSAPLPGKPSARAPRPLTVRVRAPVPVLAVEMDDLPHQLFHGETHAAQLVLHNAGTVPLTDVHALCSHPDFLLLAPPSPALSSKGALPTTNDLALPAPAPLLLPGAALAPGASIALPVLYRGAAPGAHALRVLFAFRAEGAEGGGEEEYFSTRAVREVEVYPSLEVRYALRPGRREGEALVLGLEVHNAGLPADDVSLQAVSLLSPRWRIPAALDPRAFAEDVAEQRIGWQQGLTAFVPLAAAPDEQGKGEVADLWTVGQVEALLEGKDVKGAPPQCEVAVSSLSASPDRALSSSALAGLLAEYTTYRRASLAAHYPTVPSALHSSLFPLFASRSAALVLTFSSPSLSLAPAHLLLPLDAPQPGSAVGSPAAARLLAVLTAAERRSGGLYEESRRERKALLAALRRSEIVGAGAGSVAGAPVAVEVRVKEAVQHDFSTGPLALHLRLTLASQSPSTPFSYTLSLSPSSPSRGTYSSAILAGPQTHRGVLAPLARATVDAQLWIPRAGTFAAGAYEVVLTWAGADGEEAGRVVLSGAGREVRVRDSGATAAPASAAAGAALVDVRA